MPRAPLPSAPWASPCCAASCSGAGCISWGSYNGAAEAGLLLRPSADDSCRSRMVIDSGSMAMDMAIKRQQIGAIWYDVPLLNYTTTIDAHMTIAEIQQMLAKAGASAILTE